MKRVFQMKQNQVFFRLLILMVKMTNSIVWFSFPFIGIGKLLHLIPKNPIRVVTSMG